MRFCAAGAGEEVTFMAAATANSEFTISRDEMVHRLDKSMMDEEALLTLLY